MSDDESEQKMEIRAELSNMSFEALQKLKEQLGAKVYNEAVFGVESKRNRKRKTVFKRENKNRPREASSKKPVPQMTIEESPATASDNGPRDPRFDSLCGTYNPKGFKRSYGFLTDVRVEELKTLKKELKNTVNPEQQEHIKYLIQRMENQNREEIRNKEKDLKERIEKIERIKSMREGKNPEYIRKSDKKIMSLVEQYESLKTTGKLQKHITSHRKRNTQKAKKNMQIM
ncbi:ribosomal RNA processing protein 36 homolog [Arctopsyche grandis]|uniref:ribosomal RNA processing protein 36 homolog n=1 Tax=Arctopsyche grandis TaxID=121162 RepID=UPI00406D67C1